MKKKRKLKKRIGTSALAGFVAALLALFPLAASAKKKPALDTYATLSGSVFDDRGYALPDANVTVALDAQSDSSSSGKPKGKVKPLEAVSDARGEFVLRVPPGPAHYNLSVEAKGYQAQRKSVNVEDQERVEVTFQLEHESKQVGR
jgi:hypothetical protein